MGVRLVRIRCTSPARVYVTPTASLRQHLKSEIGNLKSDVSNLQAPISSTRPAAVRLDPDASGCRVSLAPHFHLRPRCRAARGPHGTRPTPVRDSHVPAAGP